MMNIIFIPGLLCTNQVWGDVNGIREKYISYDANVVTHDSIEEMSENLIKNLPTSDFALIGISMGGYVALDVAAKKTNHLKKLILINTTAKSVNPNTISDRKNAIRLAQLGKLEQVIEASKGICYFNPKKEWLTLEKDMALQIGAESYIKQQKAIMSRKDYTSILKDIGVETLIISGKQDKILPYKDSIFLAEQIPNANLVLLNQCGHLSTLEKSKTVFQCVSKFLEM